MTDYKSYLDITVQAALEAGEAIMEVYRTDFHVETKSDQSPLTLADRRSHEIIQHHLSGLKLPVLSEEGRHLDYDQRADWALFWMVDPLDGTKEFIKKNDEFTVNIALVEAKKPVLGIVYVPVSGVLYLAVEGMGARKIEMSDHPEIRDAFSMSQAKSNRLDALLAQSTPLPLGKTLSTYTIVGSRSHGTPELDAFVEKKRQQHGDVDFIPAGSSLKICRVAEGSANIYPRLGPTMEWDTAAGHAVAAISGCRIYQYGVNEPLHYNKENLLNPWFVVERVS